MASHVEIKLWDLATRRLRAVVKQEDYTWLALSPDGRLLVSAERHSHLRKEDTVTAVVWDLTTEEPTKKFELGPVPGQLDREDEAMVISPDGKKLAVGSWGGATLWSLETGETIGSMPEMQYPLKFSPDSKLLASATGQGVIRLWDVVAGQSKPPLLGNTHQVADANRLLGLAFSPDGQTLASLSGEGLKLWDVSRVERDPSLPLFASGNERSAVAIAFSPNGRTLASAECFREPEAAKGRGEKESRRSVYQTELKLWDVAAGQQLHLLRQDGRVGHLAFSADGKTLISVDQKSVPYWDATTGELNDVRENPRDFRPPPQALASPVAAVSPHGKVLLLKNDKAIAIWNVETGRFRDLDAAELHAAAFSADAKTLVTRSKSAFALWDVATGKQKVAFARLPESVSSVALSPDGRTLAVYAFGQLRLLKGKDLDPDDGSHVTFTFTRNGSG